MKYFWTNSIWFLILFFVSIILLSYTLLKSKRRKRDFGFFFSMFGFAFVIETVIYIFLKAYEYYPRIIPQSPKNDGVIGNIASQFAITVVALFICIFDISLIGVIILGFIFFLIENLFLTLGIYQDFWYKPWITFVITIIGFEVVKKWYKTTFTSKSELVHYTNVILGVLALFLPTTNWIGILSGYVAVKANILIDPYISHAVVSIPKYLIQINMVYFLYRYRAGWVWNAVGIAVVFIGDAVLYYTKLIYIKDNWLLIFSGISVITTYLYVFAMEKLLYPGVKTG